MITVTKCIEWDMGHRIPNHDSKCVNLHGHRYKMYITVSGNVNTQDGHPKEGMVVDFSDIKNILMVNIHDKLDHGFMWYNGDDMCGLFFHGNGKHMKNISVNFIPTAENIAMWCYDQIAFALKPFKITDIVIYETPNSYATFKP